MSDYGVFEDLEASGVMQREAAREDARSIDVAISEVNRQFGRYLASSSDSHNFFERVAEIKPQLRKAMESVGVFPAVSNTRKVINAMKRQTKPYWGKQAGPIADALQQAMRGGAEGVLQGIGDVGPSDNPFMHGLQDMMVGGADGVLQGLGPEEGGPPQSPPLPSGHAGHPAGQEMLEGLQQGIGQGIKQYASMPDDRTYLTAMLREAGVPDDRTYLAAMITGSDELIPKSDWEGYLKQRKTPETDKLKSRNFEKRQGDDDWENTGNKAASLRPEDRRELVAMVNRYAANGDDADAQRLAAEYGLTRVRTAGRDEWDFTGSPETQYHHRAMPEGSWGSISDREGGEDAAYDKIHQQRAAAFIRSSAAHYLQWCRTSNLRPVSAQNLYYYAERMPVENTYALMAGVRMARRRRTAAGPGDHLPKASDAITKLLNELAADFQKSIVPLQDALQSVQFAQQQMQAQQPMNVVPPGSINVLPDGSAPQPPMAGQGMDAAGGPGGVSPMVDPNADPAAAAGGAPGGGAPGGAGGLPPEVMALIQQLSGGGGADPAAAGAPPGAAMQPQARRVGKADDDDDDDDDSDKDDGFGGKKAPPFGKKSRRYYADFPKEGDDPDDDSDDDSSSDGPPKKSPPPGDGDGPPKGSGGGDGAPKVHVTEDELKAYIDWAVSQGLDPRDTKTMDAFEAFITGDDGGAPAGPPPGPPHGAPPPHDGPPAPPPHDGPPPPPKQDGPPPDVKAARRAYIRALERHAFDDSYDQQANEHPDYDQDREDYDSGDPPRRQRDDHHGAARGRRPFDQRAGR